jgi:hypothetical protein
MAEYQSSMQELDAPRLVPEVDEQGIGVSAVGDDIIVDFNAASYTRNYEKGEHDENIAELIEPGDRLSLGMDLVEDIRQDEESRKEWTRCLRRGMEIIGLEEIPSESAAFDGAATVNHPGIAEAMVRFQANALEELFPATGPVKCTVVGHPDEETENQRERVEDFMNFQLTEADDDYFWQTDSMLMYLPFAGSCFKKIFYDQLEDMTLSRTVKGEDLIVPYDAMSLKSAPRYTHRYTITGNDLLKRIQAGEFIEAPNIDMDGGEDPQGSGEEREIRDISDKREPFRAENDVVYTLFECHCELDLSEWDDRADEDGDEKQRIRLPYVVTIEEESGEILSIRRLWNPEDEKKRKIVHFVHYKFLPGLGFYGWGYLHLIGSLGKAASGALRAVLDGAATASLQGGFKSRESKVAGEYVFTPGVWKDVDMTAEDLAKSFYTPPFKEPSPALFSTLELLVSSIRSFASTTEAMTGAADNKGPVGTTLALIEQGSKIYSGIHKRLHVAARQEFKLIAALNYAHMASDEYPYSVKGGNRSVMRQDFDGRVDIIPVSDPNIWSNVQRMALAQAGLELVNGSPDVYGIEEKKIVHREMLRAMKYPEYERLIPERKTKRLDPVTENQLILTGDAVEAFPEQDHQAHIHVHQIFVQEAAGMGLDTQVMQAAYLNMQAHLAEHHAHAYRLRVEQAMGIPLPDVDWQNPSEIEDMPIELENQVARAIASSVAPPPPAQGPQADPGKEDEHQQKLRHKDEEWQQKMRHQEEDFQNKLRQSDGQQDADESAEQMRLRHEQERHDQQLRQEQERHNLEIDQKRESGAVDRQQKELSGSVDRQVALKKAASQPKPSGSSSS